MKYLIALILSGFLLLTAGCGPAPTPVSPTSAAPSAPLSTPTLTPTPSETVPPTAAPGSAAALEELLLRAIEELRQPPLLDLSSYSPEEAPELALKNLYYGVLAKQPTLKYAYDLAVELLPDGLVRCTFSYTPYKLGQPTEGVEVSSLQSLIAAALDGLGEQDLPIRITDPGLDVDTMNRALQQVGGGYIVCELNRDATAVTYSPSMGYTMEECLALLAEAENLAAELADKLITSGMDEAHRLETLYNWLTENVLYDHRYYSDRSSMPFLSTTATGALRNNLAICGGYSHALKLLCQATGLEAYTVSGQAAGDYHAWNLVRVDGAWRYYDPTFDRGRSQYGYLYFGVDAETLAKNHQWDETFDAALTG